ncbi:unnamed protein product [Amoebophrya sp. A120]|nr:unnamed protein product [Amoebophrya sp. A120]|eukprot:GSA120T00007569001.1
MPYDSTTNSARIIMKRRSPAMSSILLLASLHQREQSIFANALRTQLKKHTKQTTASKLQLATTASSKMMKSAIAAQKTHNHLETTGGSCTCNNAAGAADWDGEVWITGAKRADLCRQGHSIKWNVDEKSRWITGWLSGSDVPEGQLDDCNAQRVGSDFDASMGVRFSISEQYWTAQDAARSPMRSFISPLWQSGADGSSNNDRNPDNQRFSFSVYITDVAKTLGGVNQMFFWTDSGSILQVIFGQNQHYGNGQVLLCTFPGNDAQKFGREDDCVSTTEIPTDAWNRIDLDMGAPGEYTVHFNGQQVATKADVSDGGRGPTYPQLGGSCRTEQEQGDIGKTCDGYTLYIKDVCLGEATGTCPSGTTGIPPSQAPAFATVADADSPDADSPGDPLLDPSQDPLSEHETEPPGTTPGGTPGGTSPPSSGAPSSGGGAGSNGDAANGGSVSAGGGTFEKWTPGDGETVDDPTTLGGDGGCC